MSKTEENLIITKSLPEIGYDIYANAEKGQTF